MSRAYITRFQGDSGDDILISLKEDDGTATDLTGATIRFHVRREGSATLVLDAAMSIVAPATSGLAKYTVVSTDGFVSNPGLYVCQVQVTIGTRIVSYDVLQMFVQAQIA